METFRSTDRRTPRRGTPSTAFTVELWPGELPAPSPHPRLRTAATAVAAGAAVVAGAVFGAQHVLPHGAAGSGAQATVTAEPGPDAYDECVLAGLDDPGELATRWRAHCAELLPGATAAPAVVPVDPPLPGVRDVEPREPSAP